MKNIISKITILASVAAVCFSCSKDFLDTKPSRYTTQDVVFSTPDSAALAINGLSRLMSIGYINSGENGEGAILLYYGNYPGQDFQKCSRTGMAYLINQTYHLILDGSYDIYPWFYYYKLIFNANEVLVNIANCKYPWEASLDPENPADAMKLKTAQNERDFIKAQALVYRAYSYLRLSELYCHRWCDTYGTVTWGSEENPQVYTGYGADTGVPLRLTPSTGDLACCYLFQLKDQVYSDLHMADSLFADSRIDRRADEFFKPNRSVANAVWARAALTWEDWETAADKAFIARQGYPLMSNDEYLESGFNKANGEWIWGTYDAVDQNMSTQGFYAYMASNGTTVNCITYPSAISKELIDKIPDSDVRKQMYLIPDPSEIEENYVRTTGRSTGLLAERAKKDYGQKLYIDNNGDLLSNIYIYMQFKFQSSNLPAVGCVPIIRASEMILTEAEALYNINMTSNKERIWDLLNELNQPRDPMYNCTKSGTKLQSEIELYRRFELWGEGFDWFDLKRKNQALVRKSLANGGSFHNSFARTIKTSAANKWTWIIPRKETDYNKLVKVVDGETEGDSATDA